MITFYELIKKIKQRPTLYINQRSLSQLKTFIDGYTFALRQVNIPVSEQEREFEDFQKWIEQKYNQPSTQHWYKIILFYAEDETDALDKFFELFREFMQQKPSNLSSQKKLLNLS